MSNTSCICGGKPVRQRFSEHFEALACKQCRSIHFVPRTGIEPRSFSYDGLDDKYSNESYLHGKELRWAHEQLLHRQWRGKKVLEIGCFNGFFVDELHKAGGDSYGFDLNERALNVGRTAFGLEGRLFSSMALLREKAPFDVILCIDLLEHLDTPEDFVLDAADMLTRGGLLVIAGPTMERRFHDKSDYPPHHKWWFSRPGLQLLLERTGYQTREMLAQRDGVLLLRNFFGKLLHGAGKREFYGSGIGAAGVARSGLLAKTYAALTIIGRVLFSAMRISYCSTLLIAIKAETKERGTV